MERMPIQFGTQLSTHQSGPLSQELAENMYLEKSPEGAKNPYILLGTPGLKHFASVGAGPIRGIHRMGSYIWVVSGGTIYRVSSAGDIDTIGAIADSSVVQMANNNTHVWVTTGRRLYAVNYSDGVLAVANGDGIVDVTYQDGYLMGVEGDTQNLRLSDIDDATTINALSVTQADTLPDNVVAVISDHREPLVLKEWSIEAFWNSGAAAFPFERTQVIEQGVVSAGSVAAGQNRVFWLGDDLVVYSMVGYSPQPISTPSVTALIKEQSGPESAQAFTYQQGGHDFYHLTLDQLTVVYDLTTGLWHRRRSDGKGRCRVQGHAWMNRWGKHIVGDFESGNLYELDLETYDENGDVLRRRVQGAPGWNNLNRFLVNEFGLDIEGGTGLVTGQGSDPKAMLDWSSDGGKTWSGELWRSFGGIGAYQTRAIWNALGVHRNWTPRITISDPVEVRISGAYAGITKMAA